MNDHEAQRIAAAMHAARPDWPASSVLTLIRKNLIDRPRRDVFVAFAWIAAEPNTATPARVLEAGPWWRAAGVEGAATTRQPFDATSFCTVCGKRQHEFTDHAFESVEARRLAVSEAGFDVHRIVTDLKARKADLPPERPKPPTTTKGTDRVAPIRAALTTHPIDRVAPTGAALSKEATL